MKIELIRSSHSVGETNLHLQVTPAFRRWIFEDELTRILVRDYFLAQSRRKKFEITAIGFGNDHVHLFVSNWKNYSPAKLAQLLKGFVSRMMREHHYDLFKRYLYGKKFWSGGYFYRTVGSVNATTVKRYVEQSQEYGYKESELHEAKTQKKLIEFLTNN